MRSTLSNITSKKIRNELIRYEYNNVENMLASLSCLNYEKKKKVKRKKFNPVVKVEKLKFGKIFKTEEAFLEMLVAKFEYLMFNKDDVIPFIEKRMYIMIEGSLSISLKRHGLLVSVFSIIVKRNQKEKNFCFGVLPVIQNRPFSHLDQIRCTEKCHFYSISRKDFLKVMRIFPKFHKKILKSIHIPRSFDRACRLEIMKNICETELGIAKNENKNVLEF